MARTSENSPLRQHAAHVAVVRRLASNGIVPEGGTDFRAIERWLLADATSEHDTLLLFAGFVERLRRAGLPLQRSSLHVGTLHPQLLGFAWVWSGDDGICEEIRVPDAQRGSDSFLLNPLHQAIDLGQQVRAKPQIPGDAARFPLLGELAARGITDYLMQPLSTGGVYHNAISLATSESGGFDDEVLAKTQRVLLLFALHVQRHITLHIAGNVAKTYLGQIAGSNVLNGRIERGSGEAMEAVIWFSDLRGFTALSERLSGEDVTKVLNAYFGALAGAVIAEEGEVLKFIGDGLLAVFPYDDQASAKQAASAAYRATIQALAAVDEINLSPPPALDGVTGWGPLRSGIAIHSGRVFFGNVGAPERLDFTVIGRAVNTAARVEALTKELGEPVLITGPVAGLLPQELRSVGRHGLRGFAEEMELFAPALSDS